MTTTANLVGLIRFQRSMVSKRNDRCAFCGTVTYAGTDYAALDNGKWIGVCALHAGSVVEQCKALVVTLQADAVSFGLDADAMAAVNAHAPANLGEVLAGTADVATAMAAAVSLTDALGAVRTYKPADPIVARLQALLAGTTATAWERDFCTSILAQVQAGKSLSEKQQATVTRVLDGKPKAASTLDLTPLKAYGTRNSKGTTVARFGVPCGDTRLKIQIEWPEGGKWDGHAFVKDAAVYGQGNRYGSQRPGQSYSGQVTEALAAIIADPLAALARYGSLTNHCGVCGLPLEKDVSVERGIGPKCWAKVAG